MTIQLLNEIDYNDWPTEYNENLILFKNDTSSVFKITVQIVHQHPLESKSVYIKRQKIVTPEFYEEAEEQIIDQFLYPVIGPGGFYILSDLYVAPMTQLLISNQITDGNGAQMFAQVFGETV